MRERRTGMTEHPRASAIANVQLPPPEAPARQPERSPVKESPYKPEDARSSTGESPVHPKTPPAIFRSETHPVPAVSGPSFLGLGDDPQNGGNYLLEQDEASSGSMLRRLVLIAILAAIAGLIFVGWRSTIFRANPKSPIPTAPAGSPSASPAASPLPQSQNQKPGSDPAASHSPESPADAPHDDAPDVPRTESKGASSSKTPSKAETRATHADAMKVSKTRKTNHSSSRGAFTDAASGHHPSAMLSRAQQYLQGRGGVKQNCQQGLLYLKAATEKNEPAAAVQMGALYASGRCVQRNEVLAYRWFNSAHELEPANPWIQANLDQLWGRMTPQQRRQVSQ
jgi:hypothetical protein